MSKVMTPKDMQELAMLRNEALRCEVEYNSTCSKVLTEEELAKITSEYVLAENKYDKKLEEYFGSFKN